MSQNIIVIHDLATNQIIERQMTDQEIADKNKFETESQSIIQTRQSALAKLSALGLTDEEIQSLLS